MDCKSTGIAFVGANPTRPTRKNTARIYNNLNHILKQERAYNFENAIKASWAEMRPNFIDFKDVYDEVKLKRDAVRLKEKRARIFAKGAFDKSEDIGLGEDFEYCLMEALHHRGWFDESVTVTPGSQYDDMFHGVDLILSFRIDDEQGGEPGYEYMAIDATVAQNPDVLEKKEVEIQRNLLNGQMAIAEYFINDDNPDIKGAIRMPQIIYALLPAEAMVFQGLLGKGKTLGFDDQKKLEEFKVYTFNKIKEQLEKWIEFLDKSAESSLPDLCKRKQEIATKYRNIVELVEKNKKG